MRTFLLGLGLPWDSKDSCFTDAPHFTASAGPLNPQAREWVREQRGFAPDQSFIFNTWGDGGLEAREEIVRGTLAICQAVPGDALLLFNGEVVLFMRKSGVLHVNSAYWRGDYSLFTPPYELEAFEVL